MTSNVLEEVKAKLAAHDDARCACKEAEHLVVRCVVGALHTVPERWLRALVTQCEQAEEREG